MAYRSRVGHFPDSRIMTRLVPSSHDGLERGGEERETGRREAEKGERRQTKRRKAGEEKKPRTGALAGRCTPWPRALRLGVEVGKPVGLV